MKREYFVFALSFFCVAIIYGAESFSCPESIKVNEKISEGPASWEAVANPQGHYFKGVAFYIGHPKEMSSLVPDRESKEKAAWQFSKKESQKFWLACEYQNTEMMLVKELPRSLSQCEVTYANDLVKSITCQ